MTLTLFSVFVGVTILWLRTYQTVLMLLMLLILTLVLLILTTPCALSSRAHSYNNPILTALFCLSAHYSVLDLSH